MPAPIAERLKSGEERIADRIETLSVMFADLVGFTEVGASPAARRGRRLPRPAGARLRRAERAATASRRSRPSATATWRRPGFDGRGREGAVAAGRLALAMLEAIGRQPPLGGRAPQLRIGIHCGPATAGVIGDTRFSYDVWGDAVNVAVAHGIERRARQDPCERGFPRAHARPLRVRGPRHDRAEGHRRRAQLFPAAREGC